MNIDQLVIARGCLISSAAGDYPETNVVEALAILTEELLNAGVELLTSVGRRVIMKGDGSEGIITGDHLFFDHYNVFIDGEEKYGISEDAFTWVEAAKNAH